MDYTETETTRMNFLTHRLRPLPLVNIYRDMAGPFPDAGSPPHRTRAKSPQRRPLINVGLSHIEFVRHISWLFSALATAEPSTLRTIGAAPRGDRRRIASASSTALPRIMSIAILALRGDTLVNLEVARTITQHSSPRYAPCPYRGEECWVMVRATSKFTRVSPRKARMAIDMIRGKAVDEADAILRLSPRGAAPIVRKVLGSAVANAENNHEMVADELYVAEAYVDQGPTLRRFRPRAMGRATRIRKRTSHITVYVDERKGS